MDNHQALLSYFIQIIYLYFILNNRSITNKLFQNWCQLLQSFDINQAAIEKTFTQIVSAYSTPNRYYHNLEHVNHVLEVIQTLESQTEDLENGSICCLVS